jgi:two-component system sensor kinase FixL
MAGERMQSSAVRRPRRDASIPMLEDLAKLHRGVALLASDGRIDWLSDALGEWFDANTVRRWEDLFAHARCGPDLWQELLSQGRIEDREVEVLTESGRRTVRISAARLAFGGNTGPVLVVLRDEAERTDAHGPEQIHHYLSAILETARDATLTLDRRGFVVCANPATERLLGQAAEAIVGQPFALCLARSEDADRIATTLGAGEQGRLDRVGLRSGDGSIRECSLTLRRIRSPEGADVTCVVRLQPKLRSDSVASLQRKNAELEHALRAVSHDLRSPLVALLGFTRLVREDYGEILGEKGRHFMQRIEQAAQTMETLIHDLLELSRIDPAEVDKSVVDPCEVMRQLQSELKPRLDATGTRLEVPEDLPLLHCDRTRLYQVLSNLVGNAVEHMGVVDAPTISLSIATSASEHRLSVRDNGRGIPLEHHDRIFEIFQSLGPRTDERRRTGVGLAIVKKIAETHGGRVWVESAPGMGATFHVTLPRPPG